MRRLAIACFNLLFSMLVSVATAQTKLEGPTRSAQSVSMPEPSPEIRRLLSMLVGTWTKQNVLPDRPASGSQEVNKAGSGGRSLISDYGPGNHSVAYWDAKRGVYVWMSCEAMMPDGCEIATGKWQGPDLVLTSHGARAGTEYEIRSTWTDITPDSVMLYIDVSAKEGPMRRVAAVKYTRNR